MKAQEIKNNIKEAYGNIAKAEKSSCCSCGGDDADRFAESLGYDNSDLKEIPDGANMALSCGNPTAIAGLREGETVLDLGSGGGFDCFIAAKKVGEEGRVIGVDMTPEMIKKARENAKKGGYSNVEFRLGDIESLPVDDGTVDVIISNCVINLASDKVKVFNEARRALKTGGRISISDIALKKELPENVKRSIQAYTGCVSGAVHVDDYEKLVTDAGFKNVKITRNNISGCGGNEEDPLAKEVSAAIGDEVSIWDYVTSVYVEATNP